MASIEADIKAINRRLDAIFAEYGADSTFYREATKFLRGSDAPKTYISKSGALHISRGAARAKDSLTGKKIEKIRSAVPTKTQIRKEFGGDDDFARRYAEADDQINSALSEVYLLKEIGALSDKESDAFERIKGTLEKSYNSKGEVVSAYESIQRIRKVH